jgi:V8-like Glu-specific endopeptidase
VTSGDRAIARAAQLAAIEYWTPERMDAAIPIKIPRMREGTAPSGTIPDAGLKPHQVPGSQPRVGSTGGPSVSPTGYLYPFPFERYTLPKAQYKTFPFMAIGKIYFRQGSFDYVCSGASVAGNPRQIVYTAGHCVSNGAGGWSSNMVFVPARRNGTNLYGVFPAKVMVTSYAWHTSGDLSYDFGAFDVGKNALGQTLRSRVGYLGFAWNQSRLQHWTIVGYPQASPFNGEKQWLCQASHAVDDVVVPGVGYDPIGVGCDLTAGVSGGPWLMWFMHGNLINSVASYKWSDQPLALYGPYFENVANQVRCTAATGTNGANTC